MSRSSESYLPLKGDNGVVDMREAEVLALRVAKHELWEALSDMVSDRDSLSAATVAFAEGVLAKYAPPAVDTERLAELTRLMAEHKAKGTAA